jgi:hypothetical protein
MACSRLLSGQCYLPRHLLVDRCSGSGTSGRDDSQNNPRSEISDWAKLDQKDILSVFRKFSLTLNI